MEGKVIPVKVAVRSRPMVDKEVNEGCQSNIMFVPNEPQLVIGKDKAFTFDFVYSHESMQDQVYREAVVPLVSGLFRGMSSIGKNFPHSSPYRVASYVECALALGLQEFPPWTPPQFIYSCFCTLQLFDRPRPRCVNIGCSRLLYARCALCTLYIWWGVKTD